MKKGKIMMVRGTRKHRDGEQAAKEKYEKTIHELSQLLIEQMKQKLEQQNRKTLKELEDVERKAERYLNETKAQRQILEWREEFKNSQQEKENMSLFERILSYLKKWSA